MAEVDQVVYKWMKQWERGYLSSQDIQEEWKAFIPKIASGLKGNTQPLDTVFDNSKFYRIFIAILEKFIFYGYTRDYIDQMCKRGESTICHRASTFSSSPYYFKCKDCTESTVSRSLCADCFANSKHRGHKYKMTSSLGRYCCCGETGTCKDAWCCSKHLGQEISWPRDIESRAKIVIETIVLYAEDILSFYRNIDKYVYWSDDEFCVILYSNSRVSIFELRSLLESIWKITEKEFRKYYWIMVLEGRITVKLPKARCVAITTELKERRSKIKGMVLHIHDVIQQKLVFNLLNYLSTFLKYGREFRRIFSKLMLIPLKPFDRSVTEHFLIYSSLLPKIYRFILNDLLINGMMKEYETKGSLAKMIVDRYGVIMNMVDVNLKKTSEFLFTIKRQLLSIPELSHHFIANDYVINVILIEFSNASAKNSIGWKNMDRNWKYDMDAVNRSVYHLDVIKIVLKSVPKTWTNELREGFLNGLICFLQVLHSFQDVDLETRETERHVEYEKDPLVGCLVLSNLAGCATLFLQWCESDNEVFGIACKETLKLINQITSHGSWKTVQLLSYGTKCLPYDSKTHPVSVHQPLFRFFVGLIGIHIRRCGHAEETLLNSAVSITLDPVLKIHAMSAQMTAGMWIRNGFSSRTRLLFYRCCYRIEIFDRDIQLLQMVAAVTEPNEFLIQILEKYNLIDWVNPNFEEDVQVVTIAEQFLQLLLMVLIERNVPEVSDVTIEDRLKHEIIHCLCIKPSSRSELELFVDSISNITETVLNNVIEEISVFRKPASNSERGTYQLKEQFFSRYNPLYYHYNFEQMPEANEFQRLRRKAAGEPDCCPPYELPNLKQFFVPMVNIFQCDVMLHIMCTVLKRFLDSESKSSFGTQLQNVLYLIGYALQEEKSNRYPMLSFTEKAARWNLPDYLEQILRISRDDSITDLLKWTIRKYKEVAHVTTMMEESPTGNALEENEKLKRSQSALAKRAKIMQEMLKMQKDFMNKKSCVSDEEETETDDCGDFASNNEGLIQKTCILCQETQKLGPKNDVFVMPSFVQYSNVLCVQKENSASHLENPLLTSNLGPAMYTSSCGHAIHAKCFQPYLELHNFEIQEFLCPLCESLSNAVLPLLPPFTTLDKYEFTLCDNSKNLVLQFTDNFQNALQVWKSLAYTIHVVEVLLRDSNKPILGHLSSRHHECLENFVKIAAVAKIVYPCESTIHDLNEIVQRGTTESLNTHFRLDLFGLLVSVTFSDHTFETIRLIFVAEIVKLLIVTNFDEMIDDVKSKVVTPFKSILQLLGKDIGHLSETFIWTYLQKASLPFLRRCVLFFSFLTNVPPPAELTMCGGETFSNMCSYLGFSQSREELFHTTNVYPYIQNWLKHPDVTDYLQNGGRRFGKTDPYHINQLTELPNEYFEIIRKAESFKCPNSYNEEATDVHICLVCGDMICIRICCSEIENGKLLKPLTLHSRKCGDGLYLRVDTCEIKFQPSKTTKYNDLFILGPYLDEYYDSDFGGENPVYLSSERYKELHTLWLSHGIFEKYSHLHRK